MSGKKETTPASGQQPDALAALKSAARHGGVKAEDQGLEATRETSPRPEARDKKAMQAEKLLHSNAEADVRKSK